jgi:myo-inositol-1(or 4)-monophosphatase
MVAISPLLNILSKSIRTIRKFVSRDFYEIEKLQSSIKQNNHFVDNSVLKLKIEVNKILNKINPELEIISSNKLPTKNCWIIDYSDYYLNFRRANDNLGIGIAFIKESQIKSYIFYNPIKDDSFFFEKGSGAFKNDFRIRVSNEIDQKEMIVSLFKKVNEDDDKEALKFLKNTFFDHFITQRELGSLNYDLCDLASGKIDCAIFVNPTKKIEMILNLILTESGGKLNIIEFQGSKIFISSNKVIEKTVQEMIKQR